MRGGAIPLLAWGTLLLVLFIGNWIWNAKAVNAAEAGLAALIIYAGAFLLWRARREALRRGPPSSSSEPQALPEGSLAAVLAGLAIGSILFGMVWGRFLVIFGIGLLAAALGRGIQELRAERRSRDQARESRQ